MNDCQISTKESGPQPPQKRICDFAETNAWRQTLRQQPDRQGGPLSNGFLDILLRPCQSDLPSLTVGSVIISTKYFSSPGVYAWVENAAQAKAPLNGAETWLLPFPGVNAWARESQLNLGTPPSQSGRLTLID